MPVWEERHGRALPLESTRLGLLCLEAFISLLQAGILGEGFSRIFINSPGVSFQGHGLH